MAYTYELLERTLIPNTTMEKMLRDGVSLAAYKITVNEGYVLHDKVLDSIEMDEFCVPTGRIILGYYPASRTCPAGYDFENTKEIDGHTAYGEREFFAIKVEDSNV